MTKLCRVCKTEKSSSDYKTDKRRPGGLGSVCRDCAAAKLKAWRAAKVEHVKAYEKKRGRGRKRVPYPKKRTPEARVANRNYTKAWEQRPENRELLRANWRKKRARKADAEGAHTAAEIAALLVKQGHKCANCSACVKQKCHADHIEPIAKGGANWIKNIQILCPACNLRKRDKDPLAWARENGRLL